MPLRPVLRADGSRSFLHAAAGTAAALLLCGGCARPVTLRATAYQIAVELDPPAHRLAGRSELRLARQPARLLGSGSAVLELALNEALKVDRIETRGARFRAHTSRPAEAGAGQPEGGAKLTIHRLVLDRVNREPVVAITYAGELYQDVQAGEKRGQIHNFLMAAHVGSEGIYLDAAGGWYPSVYSGPPPQRADLASFRLTARPVPGLRLVAGAAPDPAAAERGELAWQSKYPLDGLVLVGGPHEAKERAAGPVRLALHYSIPRDPQSAAIIDRHTDLFLAAAEQYLERYPPLIGPYPYDNYTIVENFFSSGFAFPEFTLLNRVLLQMGPRALGHGYLDHELLHSWWGNSIYVDPADGNWCEALTSYAANYYGYVLDGDERGARNQRRNYCMALSRVKPEEDQPLDRFGRPDGPPREIGYSKGALVFHMLSRRIGQEHFWAALRRLSAEYTGRYASWQTLEQLFEAQSGVELDRFLRQWVRGRGTPRLELERAVWREAARELEIGLAQRETEFALDVPVRIVRADGEAREETISLDGPQATVRLPFDAAPQRVVLDPGYEVLRQLRAEEVVPNTALTRAGRRLLIVAPEGPVSRFYERVIEDFSGEKGSKEVTRRSAEQVTPAELAGSSVLILGAAAGHPAVQALLARAECPVTLDAAGFGVGPTRYDGPEHAVLCTVHHPDSPDGGITVYAGNSEMALGRSDRLLFYRDSLVVFATASRVAEGQTIYDTQVAARRDFETEQAIPVTRE